ncbi:MAG: hypothetical protein ACT4P8_11690 [Betaproteobacteria bacterium]
MNRYIGRNGTAALILIACWFRAGATLGSPLVERESVGTGSAVPEYVRVIRSIAGARGVVLANKPSEDHSRPAKPAIVSRAHAPLLVVQSTGPGQAGFVHYFLLRLPDETLEVQVGIETADQRIAWSFPDVGVVVSPFLESGSMEVSGKDYEIWHLYGLRPFSDEASMAALRKALPGRVRTWTERNTPYCEDDGPESRCMSCLGFVMRVLFPGRHNSYPDVPHDFQRAVTGSRYTTHDLLLYLTGMFDLPGRDARLRRLARLQVPDNLRADLSILVRTMRPAAAAPASGSGQAANSTQRQPATGARKRL